MLIHSLSKEFSPLVPATWRVVVGGHTFNRSAKRSSWLQRECSGWAEHTNWMGRSLPSFSIVFVSCTQAVMHLTWFARPSLLFPVSVQILAICFNILTMLGSVTHCLWLCNSSPSSSSWCWWLGNYVFLLFVFFGLMTNFVLNILILMTVLWVSIFTLFFYQFSAFLIQCTFLLKVSFSAGVEAS